MKKRILNQEEPFTAPLSLPRIPVFTWKSHDIKLRATPDKLQKEQQSKITHLLLALQSGREITSKIFAHEISEYPPSFTRNGRMMVQMLRPGSATTFHEFFTLIIRPYILKWFDNHDRLDIVWDIYTKNSTKCSVREDRGKGKRIRVALSTKVPGNWQSFLRVDKNKEELFAELAKCMQHMELPEVRCLYVSIIL